ncbi:MAG: hypothetical protein NTV29_11835 [Planctomycetota bacterium]|nr:hypothetical protein [Planctomycetota bacterium]
MKSLIQIFESLRSLFIRSNPQTRMAMVFCTALLAVGLGLLVQNANLLSNRMEYLLDGQDFAPEQLDQFELAFSNASLRNYERTGNRMRVPSTSKDAYLKALAQAKCLPVRLDQELAGSSDPLRFLEPRSVAQQRERKERILQIQNTLKEFPFVRQAVVTYDEKSEGFSPDKKRAATVAIHPKNKPYLSRTERRNIVRLVQMHFPGLQASEVVLVDLGLGETFTEPSLGQNDTLWTDRRREHEEDIKKKATELLAGYGDVQIVISSEPVHPADFAESTPSASSTGGSDNDTSPSLVANRKARLSEYASLNQMSKPPILYSSRISVSIPTSYYYRAYRHQWQASEGDTEPSNSTDSTGSTDSSDSSGGATMSAVASHIPPITQRALDEIKTQTVQTIRQKLTPLVANAWLSSKQIESSISITDHIHASESMPIASTPWHSAWLWFAESWKTLGLFGLVMLAMLLLRSVAIQKANGPSLLDLREQAPLIENDEPLLKPSWKLHEKIQSQPEQVASRLASWISQN